MPASGGRRLVALALPPGPELAAQLAAAWQRGDAVLPLDPRAPVSAQEAVLAAARPDLPLGDDAALVIATSGSTDAPKAVELSHRALDASGGATLDRIGVVAGDRWLSCLPWHHIGGLQVLLRSRLSGVPLVVHERFDVDRFAAEPDVTLVSLVPTQLTKLLDAGVDLGRFRVILLGGAAATPHLLRRAAAAGAPVVTTYGMSETAGGCVYDGRPLTGVDVALDPDGRIRMRGPMLMSGYRGEPELTAATLVDGWLVTPDAGYWDTGYRDGDRLVVSGRLDDVIVSGGENVSAAAVAGCLVEHPSISDAVVVGVPDEQWGQRVVAVVATVGAAPALPELQSWVRDRQPEAAVPRALVVVDDIPRLSSGKPDRLAVQALAGG